MHGNAAHAYGCTLTLRTILSQKQEKQQPVISTKVLIFLNKTG
jgi:hypothetical protein